MAVVFAPLGAADVDDATRVVGAALPPPVESTETEQGRFERQRGPVFTRGRLGPLRPFLPSGGYL
jgi:hypothetical protein